MPVFVKSHMRGKGVIRAFVRKQKAAYPAGQNYYGGAKKAKAFENEGVRLRRKFNRGAKTGFGSSPTRKARGFGPFVFRISQRNEF